MVKKVFLFLLCSLFAHTSFAEGGSLKGSLQKLLLALNFSDQEKLAQEQLRGDIEDDEADFYDAQQGPEYEAWQSLQIDDEPCILEDLVIAEEADITKNDMYSKYDYYFDQLWQRAKKDYVLHRKHNKMLKENPSLKMKSISHEDMEKERMYLHKVFKQRKQAALQRQELARLEKYYGCRVIDREEHINTSCLSVEAVQKLQALENQINAIYRKSVLSYGRPSKGNDALARDIYMMQELNKEDQLTVNSLKLKRSDIIIQGMQSRLK